MKSYKQLLLSVACAALFVGSTGAMADEEKVSENEFSSKIASGENVVLFKVHDVKPIKNQDGVVKNCEFSLTLYNRSPKNVDKATMNLSWVDDSVSEVIDEEDKKDIDEIAKTKEYNEGYINDDQPQAHAIKTEDVVSKTLATTVVLPQIKPFRQVSLKSKIKSDRCFLMMENADFSFSDCSVTEPDSSSSGVNSGNSKSDCQSLFRFVSPKDPEYYREFQKVSFNEEAEKRQKLQEKDKSEMDETYKKMMASLKKVSETLQSLK